MGEKRDELASFALAEGKCNGRGAEEELSEVEEGGKVWRRG